MDTNSLTQYIDLYREHQQEVEQHAPAVMNSRRAEALRLLSTATLPSQGRRASSTQNTSEAGISLPKKGDEGYPALSPAAMLAPNYGVNITRLPFAVDASDFKCGVPNVSTLMGVVANDAFRPTTSLLRNLPKGVTVCSLAKAATENPALIEKYYDQLPPQLQRADTSAINLLNTLLAQDGVFIHVDKGVVLDKPLQIVNIFNATVDLMAARRILIVMEEDASAELLLCDHTSNAERQYMSLQVAEVYMGRGSKLTLCDLEESSAKTSRIAHLYVRQEADSQFTACGTTLMGGITRNAYCIDVEGEHAETKLAGIAIGGDKQIIDNATRVLHNVPKCHSDQMFKYIMEDQATGSFYGTIVVDEKAKFTNAYQSNRNILASADARMYTRPQLEIYCDEVKCSHGSTVGQLDTNALFYMRSRGIPEAEAKMMLMQAFMADAIDTIGIPAIKTRISQLVERRLLGQRELCGDCASTSACQQH